MSISAANFCLRKITLYYPTAFSYSILKNYSIFNNLKTNSLSPLTLRKQLFYCEKDRKIMNLSSVVETFEKHVPKHLAEKWDNTGLLVEPEAGSLISTVFFTNDLTEDVVKEAMLSKANLIISYHPPIFSSLKALQYGNWKDRIIMKCIANNIAVYSPHTACDAIQGGVNDWLIKCFDLKDLRPIKRTADKPCYLVECVVASDLNLKQVLPPNLEFQVIMRNSYEDKLWLKVLFSSQSDEEVLSNISTYPEIQLITIQDCKHPKQTMLTGMGRIGKLDKPMKLGDCIKVMKDHLKLDHFRIAIGANHTLDTEVSTIAACAGSGASLLKDAPANLYITGEMSHHDILHAHQKGTSVILCEHSNSERGYLAELADQLRPELPGVNLIVSSIDKDPVSII